MGEVRKLVIRPDGLVEALWSDKLPLAVLGHVQTVRASNVEWDENAQMWVARSTVDGRVLAASPHRDDAVRQEVAALQVSL